MKTFLLLIIMLGGSFVLLSAQTVTHQVQNEETLFSIAQEYNVTVQQLQQWNDLSGNAITIGQTLIIKKSSSTGTYTVKPNDTLFAIAQKFGITVQQLKEWNNLSDPAISVGQSLVVQASNQSSNKEKSNPPPPEKPSNSTQPAEKIADSNTPNQEEATPLPAPIKGASDGYYTVKSGDTLFRIAQLFGLEVETLKSINNLSSNNIHVGQELKIKTTTTQKKPVITQNEAVIRYKLKQGMELKEFLGVFKMSKEKFSQLNPTLQNTYINKGQTVRVVVPKTNNDAIAASNGTNLTVLGKTEAQKYSQSTVGTVTTNGELYNPDALTAGHFSMAIGSVIFVENPANGHGVIVRINDRITQQKLKLSKAAWQALGLNPSQHRIILYRINE